MRYVVASLLWILALSVGTANAQEMAQPTAEHEVLKQDLGTWEASLSMWMGPDTEPMKMEGTETNRMVGEFWLVSDFKGDFGGMPFAGHGQTGYDQKAGKYVGSWVDSTNPYAMHMMGTYDKETKTFTFKSKGINPMGEEVLGKSVLVYKDKDHRVLTMYDIVDGEEVKTMQVEYERIKE